MNKIQRLKILLVSEKLVSIITALICLCNIGMLVGKLAGGVFDWYYFFSIAVTIALSVFLCLAYIRHNLQALQAACTALLVATAYYQASYVFENLFSRSVNSYIVYGFWGSIFLATELMILILEIMLVIYHFSINIMRRRNYIRVRINQATIGVLFAMQIIELIAVSLADFGEGVQFFKLNTACFFVQLILIYVLVACAEIVLALDVREGRR